MPELCTRVQTMLCRVRLSRVPARHADGNTPRARADRLLLTYDGGAIEIAAPTESELDELEILLRVRRGAAHEAVSHHPPEARPDPKNCRYCGVRQLCDEYWTAETQRRMVQEGEDRRFGDVEVTVTGRHGPSSWDARVELSRDVPTGKFAVIRTSGDLDLSPGGRLRVLDAALMHERRRPGAASSDHARYAERGLRRSVDMPVDCLGTSGRRRAPGNRRANGAAAWTAFM